MHEKTFPHAQKYACQIQWTVYKTSCASNAKVMINLKLKNLL